MMIPVLAYRLQEQAYGGLNQQTLNKVRQLARDLKRDPKAAARMRPIKSGTRIIRQWYGHTQEVTVVQDGYSYRGKPYVSLSVIARKITGTRWSGQLFFGLRPSQKAEN
jgi:histidine ammonia-lyase